MAVTQKTDESLGGIIHTLEEKLANMMRSAQTIEQISEELQGGYISDAGRAFQTNVMDWVEKYKVVMGKFESLLSSTQNANKVLDQAEQDAHVIGGNWNKNSGIYNALQGAHQHQ